MYSERKLRFISLHWRSLETRWTILRSHAALQSSSIINVFSRLWILLTGPLYGFPVYSALSYGCRGQYIVILANWVICSLCASERRPQVCKPQAGRRCYLRVCSRARKNFSNLSDIVAVCDRLFDHQFKATSVQDSIHPNSILTITRCEFVRPCNKSVFLRTAEYPYTYCFMS